MKYLAVFIINFGLLFQLSAQSSSSLSKDGTVPPKPHFEINIHINQDASFSGTKDGVVTATAQGNGTYTYMWHTQPVQYGPTARNLGAGMHFVTATDEQGNAMTEAVTIIERIPGKLSVSPNPSNGKFLVSLEGNFEQDINLSVRNLIGQKMYSQDFTDFQQVELSLEELPRGTYLLSVKWKDLPNRYSTRIVIH